MVRKILSLGAAVFVLAGVVLFGQKAEKSGYPFNVDKDIATAVFAKKTYDEVWGATLEALGAEGYETTSSEKDAGIIKAVFIKVEEVPIRELPPTSLVIPRADQYRPIAVKVDAKEDKVAVSFCWDSDVNFTFIPAGANGKIYFSALYDKMAELLYGKVEKK